MAQTNYEKAKADCWDTFKILGGCEEVITKKDAFNYAFSKAYALGKQEKDAEEIEHEAVDYAIREQTNRLGVYPEALRSQLSTEYDANDLANAFKAGANFALGKQGKDADGEETLTVPRKKVQEMYADIIKDIRDYNGENPEMIGTTDPILRERAAGMKSQLHRLFGSKCLPDNVDTTSSNVDSSAPEDQSRNISQDSANCDKHFDNILRDSFSKDRRDGYARNSQ